MEPSPNFILTTLVSMRHSGTRPYFLEGMSWSMCSQNLLEKATTESNKICIVKIS